MSTAPLFSSRCPPHFPPSAAVQPYERAASHGLQYYSPVPGEDVVGQPYRHLAADEQVGAPTYMQPGCRSQRPSPRSLFLASCGRLHPASPPGPQQRTTPTGRTHPLPCVVCFTAHRYAVQRSTSTTSSCQLARCMPCSSCLPSRMPRSWGSTPRQRRPCPACTASTQVGLTVSKSVGVCVCVGGCGCGWWALGTAVQVLHAWCKLAADACHSPKFKMQFVAERLPARLPHA